MKETDLYPPLKAWLERQGYTVRGEVGNCDIAAVSDEGLIVVEMKLRASLKLLAQAVERQKYADSVYVALPVPPGRRTPPGWKNLRNLLRRLEIGMVTVVFRKRSERVEVLLHPGEGAIRRRPGRRDAILREIAGRELDLTPGGISGRGARMSAYRQRALRLAGWLSVLGEASPSELRQLGAPPDAGTVLSRNLYGWFVRVRRGVYTLHPSGRTALTDAADLADIFRTEIRSKTLTRA